MAGALAWDIGTVVNSEYDDDGFPTIQIDALGEEKSGVTPYDLHSPHGFLSIPLDPDFAEDGTPGLGCTALFAMEGGHGHAWLSADPRVIVKLPILKKGEALFYNSLGQFIRMDDEGAISIFTTEDGTVDGKSVYLQVAKDALRFVAPWGTLTFDAAGFRVRHHSGARMALGGIGGLPMGLGTYFKASAALVDIQGQVMASGPAGPAQPLTLADPLTLILTQVIEKLSTLCGIVAPIVGTTGSGAAALPLVEEVAALTAQLKTIAAKSSSV